MCTLSIDLHQGFEAVLFSALLMLSCTDFALRVASCSLGHLYASFLDGVLSLLSLQLTAFAEASALLPALLSFF